MDIQFLLFLFHFALVEVNRKPDHSLKSSRISTINLRENTSSQSKLFRLTWKIKICPKKILFLLLLFHFALLGVNRKPDHSLKSSRIAAINLRKTISSQSKLFCLTWEIKICPKNNKIKLILFIISLWNIIEKVSNYITPY